MGRTKFCISKSPVPCCGSDLVASTSGRELLLGGFSYADLGVYEGRGRRIPAIASSTLSSTASVKAQAPKELAKPKQAASGGEKPIHDVLAGALARAISQATIHPIDTLKVRMQAASRAVASGPAAAGAGAAGASAFSAASAAAAAGPHHLPSGPPVPPLSRLAQRALGEAKILYRGVLGAAGGAGIIIGAFFAFYSTSKRLLRERTNLPEGTVAFIAGAVAAVGSSVVKVPIAVCIRSVQAGVYPNALAAAAAVTRRAGPAGLFTGFLPTLLEDVPDMAVKFAVYETLRAVHMRLHHLERPSTLEDLVMGGVAGSAAAAATTPLDVVKTRVMCAASERPSLLQAVRGVMAEAPGGAAAFFRGVGPRALSNGLNSAIFYCWFELLRAALAEAMAKRQRQAPPPALALVSGAAAPSTSASGRAPSPLPPTACGMQARAAGARGSPQPHASTSQPQATSSEALAHTHPQRQQQQQPAAGTSLRGAPPFASCSMQMLGSWSGKSEDEGGLQHGPERSRSGCYASAAPLASSCFAQASTSEAVVERPEEGRWREVQPRKSCGKALEMQAREVASSGLDSGRGLSPQYAGYNGELACLSMAMPVWGWPVR